MAEEGIFKVSLIKFIKLVSCNSFILYNSKKCVIDNKILNIKGKRNFITS